MNMIKILLVWGWAMVLSSLQAKDSVMISKTHYVKDHRDKVMGRVDCLIDNTIHEMVETTYNSNNVVTSKKKFLLNEKGLPLQGNIYDGRGKLIARCVCSYDELGRRKEDKLINLKNEVFQLVTHQYDVDGKELKPKVINMDGVAVPLAKANVEDFTQNSANASMQQRFQTNVPTDSGQARFSPLTQAELEKMQNTNHASLQPQAQGGASAPAAPEPIKKKSFLDRMRGK
jgi:hypothetical protein